MFAQLVEAAGEDGGADVVDDADELDDTLAVAAVFCGSPLPDVIHTISATTRPTTTSAPPAATTRRRQ